MPRPRSWKLYDMCTDWSSFARWKVCRRMLWALLCFR
ncbi:hypothetical protein X975_08968, partial [Stegodyphus mimosarum]